MIDEKKPKEFWIIHGQSVPYACDDTVHTQPLRDSFEIHVIEYSAYEQLKSKLEIAKKGLNTALNYLHWREDDLIGDDCIGDGKLTAAYKNRVSEIEQALKEINEG